MGPKKNNPVPLRLVEEINRLRILQEKGAPVRKLLRSARARLAKLLMRPSDAVVPDSK